MVQVGTDKITFQSLEPKPKSVKNTGVSRTHGPSAQIRKGLVVQDALSTGNISDASLGWMSTKRDVRSL